MSSLGFTLLQEGVWRVPGYHFSAWLVFLTYSVRRLSQRAQPSCVAGAAFEPEPLPQVYACAGWLQWTLEGQRWHGRLQARPQPPANGPSRCLPAGCAEHPRCAGLCGRGHAGHSRRAHPTPPTRPLRMQLTCGFGTHRVLPHQLLAGLAGLPHPHRLQVQQDAAGHGRSQPGAGDPLLPPAVRRRRDAGGRHRAVQLGCARGGHAMRSYWQHLASTARSGVPCTLPQARAAFAVCLQLAPPPQPDVRCMG